MHISNCKQGGFVKIDDASWHYDSESFPKELSSEAGATHIGFFVAWAALNGMISEELELDLEEQLASLRAKEISPGLFVWRYMDGKFSEHDLKLEGQRFSSDCYHDRYLAGYEQMFKSSGQSEYGVTDDWNSYILVAPMIDSAYSEWLNKPR